MELTRGGGEGEEGKDELEEDDKTKRKKEENINESCLCVPVSLGRAKGNCLNESKCKILSSSRY